MDKLKKLVKDVDRRKAIDEDLQVAQWAVQNEEEAKIVLGLVERKHLDEVQGSDAETAVTAFFAYFQEQWGHESHTSKWWEAAHPFCPSNNQGNESFNNTIKEEKTFRERLPIGQYAEAMESLCTEHSQKDDTQLFGNR